MNPELISFSGIKDIINQIVAYTLILAAFLAVIFIIFGGILFITAAGNEDRTKRAVHTIKYAIIGLIVCIFAFSIVYYIGIFLGYNFFTEYLTFDSIMSAIQGIGEKFTK